VVARVQSSFWRNTEGSALLEGAILVPVLMALMFGVYDFSWFFYRQHLMTIGVHDAARYLARSPDACNTASPAWPLETANAGNLATTGVTAGGSARISGWSSGMITITCTPIENRIGADGLRTYRGDAQIYVVTVASQLADPSLGFFRLLGLPGPRISVAHSERVIGPG
jgi:Flp pilus assembly protein TadG